MGCRLFGTTELLLIGELGTHFVETAVEVNACMRNYIATTKACRAYVRS